MGKVNLTYILVSFYKAILTDIVYVTEFSHIRFTKKCLLKFGTRNECV